MTPETVYVHASTLSADSYHRIAATGGSVSVSTESEQSAGQGYPTTWAVRSPRHPRLTSRWTRACGGAETSSPPCAPHSAPTAPASTWKPTPRARPSPTARCAPTRSWSGQPAAAPGALAPRTRPGQHRGGQEGRPRPAEERPLTGLLPAAQPVRPRAPSRPSGATCTPSSSTAAWSSTNTVSSTPTWPAVRRTVEQTVDHLRSTIGEEAWAKGMNPDVPETKILDNPYTYTDYRSTSTHGH
ncbi:hypothetical protein ACRAWF_01420 [Streptomyces sp. L7]